jgi:hypothetical protein
MRTKSLALIACLLAGCAGSAFALEWNERQLSLKPEPGATEVRGKFDFKNSTGAVVHIVDLTTSCGCTVARTASPDIAAGASGTINFVFTVGKRSGLQEKKIFVQTDESPDPVVLELKIQLPEGAAGGGNRPDSV